MRKFVVHYKDDLCSQKIKNEIISKLEKSNFIFDSFNPDIIICVGGDGTFLRAIHHYTSLIDKAIFIGVKTGTLGFYASYKSSQIDNLIADICDIEKKEIGLMPLLKVKVNNHNYFSLNEVRIENNLATLTINVYIDGNFLEKFRGNGLMVCTPTGSTAYNRSLSGPIIDHKLKAITLTEIAGIHHNKYRSLGSSLVLAGDRKIALEIEENSSNVFGIDNLIIDEGKIEKIEISLSQLAVRVIKLKKEPFISRIKDSLIK